MRSFIGLPSVVPEILGGPGLLNSKKKPGPNRVNAQFSIFKTKEL